MKVSALNNALLDDLLDDVARLRVAGFRDWPYLYEGDYTKERGLMEAYKSSAAALFLGVYEGDWLVGVSTAAPLADHKADFVEPFRAAKIDFDDVYYWAESALLPKYRNDVTALAFLDMTERHARAKGYGKMGFCSILRPSDHPLRPPDERSLDRAWRDCGYAPVQDFTARFTWKDVDQDTETPKDMQFWIRNLDA